MPDRSAFPKRCDRSSEFRLAVLEAWCPRTRGGSGAGGVTQIAAGIDAFTRHTGLHPLVRLKLKRLFPLRTVERTRRARTYTLKGVPNEWRLFRAAY